MSIQNQNKIWWDEEARIIRNFTQGYCEESEAKIEVEKIRNIVNTQPGKVSLLIDISEAEMVSSGARKVFADLMKSVNLEKIAFVGMKVIPKTIASFIMRYSGVKNARFFETGEQALEWLKIKEKINENFI